MLFAMRVREKRCGSNPCGGWGAGLLPPRLSSRTDVGRLRCGRDRFIDAKCDGPASGSISRFGYAVIDDTAGEIAALGEPL